MPKVFRTDNANQTKPLPCEINYNELQGENLYIVREPSVLQPYFFHVRIVQHPNVEDYFDKRTPDQPKPSYLDLPIASGDWYGISCTVCGEFHNNYETGEEPTDLTLYGKVTWGRLLKRLYKMLPTDTNAEDYLSEKQAHTEMYDVEVSLLFGSEVQ